MTLHDVALDDKFDLGKERIFLSGAQADRAHAADAARARPPRRA